MAYKKADIIKESINFIETNRIASMDVFLESYPKTKTFLRYKLDKLDAIKDLIAIFIKTNEVKKEALKLIEDKELVFIEDVTSLLPISRATFYNYKLHEDEEIKDSLAKQRTTLKVSLRKKWYQSDNATTQIALYKLIGTDREAHRLNGSKLEHTGKDGEPIKTENTITVNIVKSAEVPKKESEEISSE